jgi:predicted permease
VTDWRSETRARLAALRLRPEREAEIVEEVAQHLDDRYREMRTAGRDHEAAIAEAWRELEASGVLAREVARSELSQPLELPPPGAPSRGRWFAAAWQDLRFAMRSLRQQPAFTATVLTALALSIGPTTAILSVGNWLFWRPLPGVVNSRDLAVVDFGRMYPNGMRVMASFSHVNLAELRSRVKSATGLAGVSEQSVSLVAGSDSARTIRSAFVTADFFEVLGGRLVAGRAFTAEENQPGASVVVSDGLARRAFGSPAAAIDQPLLVNRQAFQVVGVAPAGFTGITTTSAVEVWSTRADAVFGLLVARVAPGATFTQLEAELGVLARGLAESTSEENKQLAGVSATVYPGLGTSTISRERTRSTLRILYAIGGVLLLLGCANVANMLIARTLRRQPEVAVRKALGASTWRLVQLELTESCLLSVCGAALGLAVALLLRPVVQQLVVPSAPGGPTSVLLDMRVLALTIAASVVVAVIAGIAPGWLSASGRASAITPNAGLRTATRVPRLRSGLAVVQLALSLTLLVGALLLAATLRNLYAVDLGFNPDNVAVLRMSLDDEGYDAERSRSFREDLLPLLEATPSIGTVTLAHAAPFLGGLNTRVVPPGADDKATVQVQTNAVAENYFDVLGMSLVRGRTFTRAETFAASPMETVPVVVNQSLARRLFGDADPIGRTLRIPKIGSQPARDWPIVGVVRDAYSRRVTEPLALQFFQPIGRFRSDTLVIVRSSRPLAEVIKGTSAAVARIDARVPIKDAYPLSMWIDNANRQARSFATMLTWMAVLAFVLAAVGLHGLVTQTTTERMREFGIRLAIGASRGAIATLVARRVVVITSIGCSIGLGLAAVSSKVVKSMLFGVTAIDPLVYTLAVVMMACVVALAAAWPAFRATRVDPVDVLRAE